MSNIKKIRDGKKARIAGFVFLGLFVLAIVLSIASQGESILGMILFFLSLPMFIILFIVGGVRGANARRYKKYLPHVSRERDIENIATIAGTSYRRTERDLASLSKKGLLQGLKPDRAAKKLVEAGSPSAGGGFYRKDTAQGGTPAAADTVSVTCAGCGAPNDVKKGGAAECEFCGAQLRVE